MDIKGLQYFMAAAENMNFTAGAKQSYITQTAMSIHIDKMENELGFLLFTRKKHRVELTEAGKDFYGNSKKIVQMYNNAVRHASNIAKGMRGQIRIMLPSYAEGVLLLDKFKEFLDTYPDVNLDIYTGKPGRHIRNLKCEQTDIYIGAPDDMEYETDFIVKYMGNYPAIVICSSNHPLANFESVDSTQILDERIIVCGPKGLTHTHHNLTSRLLNRDILQQPILHVNNLDEIILNVEIGLGIGIVPDFINLAPAFQKSNMSFIPYTCEGNTVSFEVALGYMKTNQNPVLHNFMVFMSL